MTEEREGTDEGDPASRLHLTAQGRQNTTAYNSRTVFAVAFLVIILHNNLTPSSLSLPVGSILLRPPPHLSLSSIIIPSPHYPTQTKTKQASFPAVFHLPSLVKKQKKKVHSQPISNPSCLAVHPSPHAHPPHILPNICSFCTVFLNLCFAAPQYLLHSCSPLSPACLLHIQLSTNNLCEFVVGQSLFFSLDVRHRHTFCCPTLL